MTVCILSQINWTSSINITNSFKIIGINIQYFVIFNMGSNILEGMISSISPKTLIFCLGSKHFLKNKLKSF